MVASMAVPEKYPRLIPDSPAASRGTNACIAQYAALEGTASPEAYSEQDVQFIRSAACEGYDVWLWSCQDGESAVYVYAIAKARRVGSIELGMSSQSTATIAPEEFLRAMGLWPALRSRRGP
jgi:hypothetical protein